MSQPAAAWDVEPLRRDVEALAAMERGSASEGERASAEWIAERLAAAGIGDVRLESFQSATTFAGPQGAHMALGVAAAQAGGALGAAVALGTLVSYELDFSGRSQWLRGALPRQSGTNVVARVPAAREARRTLVLVAHHDAARTGLMWNPALAAPGRRRAAETGRTPSFALTPVMGLAAVAAGCALGSRTARAAGAAIAGLTGLLLADQARSPVVPGASDNATGVAAVLALGEWLAAEPPEDVETVLVVPGCEESGMGGMRAWLDSGGRALDRARTLVLGLDTLGSGEPHVLSGEGGVRTERYRDEDIGWTDLGAARAGLDRPPRWRIGGWTDPVLALQAGLPAISIVSSRDGGFANYHLPTDTPENVDWGSVERCLRLAAGTIEAWVGDADEEVGSAA